MDMDQRSKGNQRGRIILLGDGSEVLTDSDDTEMFDHAEEDKDLESQVHKGGQTKEDTTIPEKLTLPEKSTIKSVSDEILPSTAATKEETGAGKASTSKSTEESK